MFKVGDLVNWDGTIPSYDLQSNPRFNGRIVKIDFFNCEVDWPIKGVTWHKVNGSVKHFSRVKIPIDKFEENGVE